jgi:hypothetical protein
LAEFGHQTVRADHLARMVAALLLRTDQRMRAVAQELVGLHVRTLEQRAQLGHQPAVLRRQLVQPARALIHRQVERRLQQGVELAQVIGVGPGHDDSTCLDCRRTTQKRGAAGQRHAPRPTCPGLPRRCVVPAASQRERRHACTAFTRHDADPRMSRRPLAPKAACSALRSMAVPQ